VRRSGATGAKSGLYKGLDSMRYQARDVVII
jgi:hypothetical protein